MIAPPTGNIVIADNARIVSRGYNRGLQKPLQN